MSPSCATKMRTALPTPPPSPPSCNRSCHRPTRASSSCLDSPKATTSSNGSPDAARSASPKPPSSPSYACSSAPALDGSAAGSAPVPRESRHFPPGLPATLDRGLTPATLQPPPGRSITGLRCETGASYRRHAAKLRAWSDRRSTALRVAPDATPGRSRPGDVGHLGPQICCHPRPSRPS
jgi:hypothetical protein